MAISAKETAWNPLNRSSELIVGPTNSDLLNSTTLSWIKFLTELTVSILSWLLLFWSLIKIIFSLPNSCKDTSL